MILSSQRIQAPGVPEVNVILFTKEREGFTHAKEIEEDWIVLGLKEGVFRYAFDEGPEDTCEAGDFLVCPPGVCLSRKALGKIRFYLFRFSWKNASAADWQGKHTPVDVARMESTLSHLEQVQEHPENKHGMSWAGHLLSDLLRQSFYEKVLQAGAVKKTPDRLMIQVSEKFRKEMRNPSSLDELAGRLRLTPSQLSRRFTAAFGMSPSVYRTRIRIQESKRMLLETPLSIQEIAEACGFENAFYFSRVFSREEGQPPSHYRRSRRV